MSVDVIRLQQETIQFFCHVNTYNNDEMVRVLNPIGVKFFNDVVYGSLHNRFHDIFEHTREHLGEDVFFNFANDYFLNSRKFSTRTKPNNIYIAFTDWLKLNASLEVFELSVVDVAVFLASSYREELIYINVQSLGDIFNHSKGVFAVHCHDEDNIELSPVELKHGQEVIIGFQKYWDRK